MCLNFIQTTIICLITWLLSFLGYHKPQQSIQYSGPQLNRYHNMDETFQSQIITENIEIKWRMKNIPSCHPDIIFTLENSIEILVLGFNQNELRYDGTRMTIIQFQKQSKDLYESTVWTSLKKSLSVKRVLLIADRVAKQQYKNFINNCEESARYLIEQLNNEDDSITLYNSISTDF